MNCETARAAFSDLYDGMLTGPGLADLRRHLDDCPDCQWEWAAFRRTVHAVRDLGGGEPSPDFAARVARRVAAPPWWRRAASALVRPLPVKLPIHAAALVVLGLTGLWVWQRSPDLRRAGEGVTSAPIGRAPAPERAAQAPPTAPPASSRAPAQPPKPTPRAPSPVPESGPGRPAHDEAATASPPPPVATTREAESEPAASGMLRSARAPLDTRGQTESTAPKSLGLPAEDRTQPASAPETADAMFSLATAEFAAQRYERAVDAFRAFLAQYPADTRAPDARFLLADAYRALGRHAEAGAGFAAFLRLHPAHRRVPAALFRQAESRVAAADLSGCAMLRDALTRYPEDREATQARETLAARCP